jgi:hypothetical protein
VEKPLSSVYIPSVRGVSEKFSCIGNQYNNGTIFKTKYILMSSFTKARLERYTEQMALWVYSISSEYSTSYIGEPGRPLDMWLHLKYSILE